MTRSAKLSRMSVLSIATQVAATTRTRKASPEHDAQVRLFEAIDAHPVLRDALIYAVPNAGGYRGGFKANAARAARMKAEGVRRGPPDINVDEARQGWHGLRIEMKARKNRPTSEQREWIDKLVARGYRAVVCYSEAEAWQVLIEYMGVTAGPLYTQPQFNLPPSPRTTR